MASWLTSKLFGSPAPADAEEKHASQPQRAGAEEEEEEEEPPALLASASSADGEVLAELHGRLLCFSAARREMVPHPGVRAPAALRLVRRAPLLSFVCVDGAVEEEVSPAFVFDRGNHSLVWTSRAGGAVVAWSFVVEGGARGGPAEEAFARAFVRAQVEARRGVAFDKAVGKKEADQQYVLDAHRVPTTSVGGFEDDDDDERARMDWAQEDTDDDADGWGRHRGGSSVANSAPAFAADSSAAAAGERNAHMAVGMANNRTFVMRGSQVGVFKHDDDERLEYVGRIPEVRTRAGELFTPSKVQLHERDRRLLMLNPDDQQHVYCLDLETEKVVEQWEVGDGMPARSIGATEKYAQRTNESMVVGVNNNTVFSLDPRLNTASKLARKKTYAKTPGFTCLATTDEGRAAVGSRTGEIRLYSDIEKRAKTCLPGLGDAVTGIDTTGDGLWVLATTDTYLLLASTEIDGDDSGKTGFDKPMGAGARPPPIKLQLHPHDLARYNIQEVKFTAAHFNVGEGARVEEWIVTSTGPYIITWNFRSARRGRVYDYRVKREYQEVVADQFRFGKDDQVVVTLTDDVLLQKRGVRPV